MKSKKILFIFIIALAILLGLNAKADATLELNELDFDVQVNVDGSMNVTETWNIYISEINTLFKTFKKDSSKYSGITDVTVKDLTADKELSKINEEMYHVTKDCYYALTNSKGMFEIAWGVGLDDDYDTRRYQISYKVQDAIAKYDDYSELYWQFIGKDFEIDAKKLTGTILLPMNAENKEEIRVWGHTQQLNGEIYATANNKIEFTINRYSSGNNYVEVRTLIPNYMITSSNRTYSGNILNSVIEEETKWADEANARRELKNKIVYAIAGILIIFSVYFLIKVFKKIRRLKKLDKKIKPSTKLEYFRELPYEDATPAEALFVLTSGMNKNFSASFSANILDLCLKKYITLEVVKKDGIMKSDIVKISLLDKSSEALKEDEKLTLEFLKEVAKENNELTTKDITKYLEKHTSRVEKLNKELEKIIENAETVNGNYSKENYNNMNKYGGICAIYMVFAFFMIPITISLTEISNLLIISTIPLLVTLIVNAIILGIMSAKVNVFTQKGVDEKEQWKAFKKYMEDFSLLKDKEIPSLVVWEKYLVFATAFGISEKVLKQLKVVYPEITNMDSAMYTYSYIHIMNSVNIGSCINSSVYSAIGSSGSGAGGGFSGGGGGGRWPEAAVADAKLK